MNEKVTFADHVARRKNICHASVTKTESEMKAKIRESQKLNTESYNQHYRKIVAAENGCSGILLMNGNMLDQPEI